MLREPRAQARGLFAWGLQSPARSAPGAGVAGISATLGGCLVPKHSSYPGTRRSLLLPRLETEEGHGDPNAHVTGSSRANLGSWAPFYMWLAMYLRLERKTPTMC